MNLKQFLEESNIWHRFVEKDATVHTADAASASGIPLERITKSLVFLDEKEEPVMAVVLGIHKVSSKKLASAIGAKDVSLVPFEKAEKYSCYPPGGTCPIFHRKKMRVVVDEKVMQSEAVFNGGGSRSLLVELKTADIVRLNCAIVADIIEGSRVHKGET